MKKLIVFFIVSVTLQAQNLDSLYNAFVKIRGIKTGAVPQVLTDGAEPVKCTFGLNTDIRVNYDKFSPKQKSVLSALLTRPVTDTSIVTPSGKFRIHYDKTGRNAPAYGIQALAVALDSAYKYEVNILRYPPPPSDGIAGGDDKYDIYIQNLADSEYGTEYPEEQLTSKTYTSFILIDNDFIGQYYTHGIEAARVTVAHELQHAIQIGNYGDGSTDRFFYESSASAMEEFVFDNVNDYYYFIGNYLSNTAKSISLINGYYLAIWNIFLKEKYGIDVIRQMWEGMKTKRAVEAFESVLTENGTTFKNAFNLFGLWCYFTNDRAVAGKYFDEAAQYSAKVKPLMTTQLTDQSSTISVALDPSANCYLQFDKGESVFVAIITNGDIQTTYTKNYFDYQLSTSGGSGFRQLTNGYYSKIGGDKANLSVLVERDILNNIPLNPDGIPIETANYAYPQPFRYSSNSPLFLPATMIGAPIAEVKIYSIDMNLVYSGEKTIIGSNKIVVAWNGMDNSGNKLPTGVYLYMVKCGDEILKGKFVIYND